MAGVCSAIETAFQQQGGAARPLAVTVIDHPAAEAGHADGAASHGPGRPELVNAGLTYLAQRGYPAAPKPPRPTRALESP